MENGKKKIIHLKDGKETVSFGECNNIKLATASKYIEEYWYEIIKDVFSYERARNAGLQEVHKLFTDDRILMGLELFKKDKIKDVAITDVDVMAKIEGEEGTYTVILKNWKPEKLLRHRHEIEQYISESYASCNCLDCQINGHYRNNSVLYCKHLCGLLWLLMEKYNLPKFFISPSEKDKGYQKSNNIDLVKDLQGVSMKQFSQSLNVVALRDYRGIPTSLSYSIHRKANKGYEKLYPNGFKPIWITFDNIEAVEKLIKANIRGLVEMLASRGNTETQIKEAIKRLIPTENGEIKEEKTLHDVLMDEKDTIPIEQAIEEAKKIKEGWFKRMMNKIRGWLKK